MPRIESLTAENFEGFLSLLEGYHEFYRVRPSQNAVRGHFLDLMEAPQLARVLLSRKNEDLVGMSVLLFYPNSLICRRAAYLHDLYVAPRARGQGVARALVHANLKLARESGCPQLSWHTEGSNRPARALYEKLTKIQSQWIYYGMDTGRDPAV